MNIIATYEGKPIYATNENFVDMWKLGQGLSRHSGFKPDFEQYKRNPVEFFTDMLRGYEVQIYKWNIIENDWIRDVVKR